MNVTAQREWERLEEQKAKYRRETNGDDFALFIVFNVFFLSLSRFRRKRREKENVTEGARSCCRRQRGWPLCICAERERTIWIEKNNLDMRWEARKKRDLTLCLMLNTKQQTIALYLSIGCSIKFLFVHHHKALVYSITSSRYVIKTHKSSRQKTKAKFFKFSPFLSIYFFPSSIDDSSDRRRGSRQSARNTIKKRAFCCSTGHSYRKNDSTVVVLYKPSESCRRFDWSFLYYCWWCLDLIDVTDNESFLLVGHNRLDK